MTQKAIGVLQMMNDDQKKLIRELLFIQSHMAAMVKHKHKDPQGRLSGYSPQTHI